jgi:hypothetical protein
LVPPFGFICKRAFIALFCLIFGTKKEADLRFFRKPASEKYLLSFYQTEYIAYQHTHSS